MAVDPLIVESSGEVAQAANNVGNLDIGGSADAFGLVRSAADAPFRSTEFCSLSISWMAKARIAAARIRPGATLGIQPCTASRRTTSFDSPCQRA